MKDPYKAGKTVRHYLSPDSCWVSTKNNPHFSFDKPFQRGGEIPSLHIPLSQVLKTGQGVMEYLKLEGILDQDTIVDIGKNVLQLNELKISMILSL